MGVQVCQGLEKSSFESSCDQVDLRKKRVIKATRNLKDSDHKNNFELF